MTDRQDFCRRRGGSSCGAAPAQWPSAVLLHNEALERQRDPAAGLKRRNGASAQTLRCLPMQGLIRSTLRRKRGGSSDGITLVL